MEEWRKTTSEIINLGALLAGVYVTAYAFTELLPEIRGLGRILTIGLTSLVSSGSMIAYNNLYSLINEQDSISVSLPKLD